MTFETLPRAATGAIPLLVSLLTFTFAAPAQANFVLLSQQLSIDWNDRVATFELTFNQRPDFTTLDADGRPANGFQIDFSGNRAIDALPYPQNLTAVVRGEEIHLAHALRIREATGDGGSQAGGWGPVVAAEPFRLDENRVSFSTTIEDLGLTGREFRYSAYSLEFGDLTSIQTVRFVPLPSAVGMFAAGAIPTLFLMYRAKRLSRSRSHRPTGDPTAWPDRASGRRRRGDCL